MCWKTIRVELGKVPEDGQHINKHARAFTQVPVMVEHNGRWVRAIAHVPIDGDDKSRVAASGECVCV